MIHGSTSRTELGLERNCRCHHLDTANEYPSAFEANLQIKAFDLTQKINFNKPITKQDAKNNLPNNSKTH
ncbi:unnamed protein product [Dovyalis caffra]|uniref:Uncharacterized protein n=1 Tax=Dovyalis caffra TaxID=77055 RepID=A0AAV1QYA1_9ROSI|nr:unnamed protein product [Dovyalis caffra]